MRPEGRFVLTPVACRFAKKGDGQWPPPNFTIAIDAMTTAGLPEAGGVPMAVPEMPASAEMAVASPMETTVAAMTVTTSMATMATMAAAGHRRARDGQRGRHRNDESQFFQH
jgi:hypothetical protein